MENYLEERALRTVLQYELNILFTVTVNIKMVTESALSPKKESRSFLLGLALQHTVRYHSVMNQINKELLVPSSLNLSRCTQILMYNSFAFCFIYPLFIPFVHRSYLHHLL